MEIAQERDIDTVFVYSDYFNSRVFLAFAPEGMEVFAVNNSSIDDTGSTWINDQLRMQDGGIMSNMTGTVCLLQTSIRRSAYLLGIMLVKIIKDC